jgi:hypothetical protein
MVAILKFKMDAFTKSSNIINTAFNGFIYPENMGIDTKFIILGLIESKIWQLCVIGGRFLLATPDVVLAMPDMMFVMTHFGVCIAQFGARYDRFW